MKDEKIRKWILYHGKGLTLADEHCLWELCDDIRTQRDAEWLKAIDKAFKENGTLTMPSHIKSAMKVK